MPVGSVAHRPTTGSPAVKGVGNSDGNGPAAEPGDGKMAHYDPTLSIGHSRLSTAAVVARTTALGQLERDVVLVSRSDPRSSLRPLGVLGRLGRRLFGFARPNPLADVRLEALRRFAILLRHHRDGLSHGEETRLLDAGFTPEQMRDVRRLVLQEQPRHLVAAIRRRYVALACVVIAVEIALFRLCTAYLNDGLLGLVGALLPLVSATPLVTFLQRTPRTQPSTA